MTRSWAEVRNYNLPATVASAFSLVFNCNDKNIHIPNPYIKVIGSFYYRPLELTCGTILGGWNIRRQLRAQVHK